MPICLNSSLRQGMLISLNSIHIQPIMQNASDTMGNQRLDDSILLDVGTWVYAGRQEAKQSAMQEPYLLPDASLVPVHKAGKRRCGSCKPIPRGCNLLCKNCISHQ